MKFKSLRTVRINDLVRYRPNRQVAFVEAIVNQRSLAKIRLVETGVSRWVVISDLVALKSNRREPDG